MLVLALCSLDAEVPSLVSTPWIKVQVAVNQCISVRVVHYRRDRMQEARGSEVLPVDLATVA